MLLTCAYGFVASEIWDALRAAAEADISLAQAIIDSAGVIIQNVDLTVCYDERGTLPFYLVLNIVQIFLHGSLVDKISL